MMRLNRVLAGISAGLGLTTPKIFAMTQSVHDVNYEINSHPDLVPFLIMGAIFSIVLYAYYKTSHVTKYEKFSLHCTRCGRFTRGLKCVICDSRK